VERLDLRGLLCPLTWAKDEVRAAEDAARRGAPGAARSPPRGARHPPQCRGAGARGARDPRARAGRVGDASEARVMRTVSLWALFALILLGVRLARPPARDWPRTAALGVGAVLGAPLDLRGSPGIRGRAGHGQHRSAPGASASASRWAPWSARRSGSRFPSGSSGGPGLAGPRSGLAALVLALAAAAFLLLLTAWVGPEQQAGRSVYVVFPLLGAASVLGWLTAERA